MTVFNFGSINIDYLYRVPHLVTPGETLSSRTLQTVLGGKGANQSVALAQAGMKVVHIGKIGKNDTWARDQLADFGVDVAYVTLDEGPSGHAIIQVDDAGENSIILHAGANGGFDHTQLADALAGASSLDWLLMQNECNALPSAFELAKATGMRIAFNPAPMDADVSDLPLELCQLLILNETEAIALAGTDDLERALAALATRYPDTRLVLTLGAKGAIMRHGKSSYQAAAVPVDVVDTTGAGDTFVGYYLAMLAGEPLDEQAVLQRACAAAALSVTREGATPGIPSASQLDAFLSSYT